MELYLCERQYLVTERVILIRKFVGDKSNYFFLKTCLSSQQKRNNNSFPHMRLEIIAI